MIATSDHVFLERSGDLVNDGVIGPYLKPLLNLCNREMKKQTTHLEFAYLPLPWSLTTNSKNTLEERRTVRLL